MNAFAPATVRSGIRRSAILVACLAALIASCAGREQEAPAAPGLELEEMTIAQLQQAMTAGRHTSRQLVESYLKRIEDIDRHGPALRSIIEVNPDALAIADGLDAERREQGSRGPLHGIPILLKDNIDTADRMATSAGSLALADSIAPRDAFLVERLRAAGAVIIAKTNLSEWANFRSMTSTSGWSARGGQVKNPYSLDRNPCGSSSGSGVAVAANLAAAAVGTETDGSIVCPAGANGIVGIKPTVGLVSRSGIIPISASQDTAGPMARTVADAAILLAAMTGVDPRDPATGAAVGHPTEYAQALDAGALRGARIGVSRKGHSGYSPGVDRLLASAIEAMKSQGAEIVDPVDIPNVGKTGECELEILLYEFKDGLDRYLAGLGPAARVHTLAEVISYNEREREREMPYFGQDLFERAQKKGPLSEPDYLRHRAECRRLAGSEGIDAAIASHRLDALVAPTGAPAWPTDLVNGDHFLGGSSGLAAIAGYPNISVPMGQLFGLPVGISFFGPAWSEARLIGIAHAFEQATRHRRAPEFPATVLPGDKGS
ncbi:MAG: amidase [Gammaproteobacteria bacterium]